MPIPFLAAARVAPWFKKAAIPVGLALTFGVLLMLAFCHGKKEGKAGEVIGQQERTIETKVKVGKANESAAGERVSDAKKLQTEREELRDAHVTIPGDSPADARARHGCSILRQQGRDTSRIPACARFEGAAGTRVP